MPNGTIQFRNLMEVYSDMNHESDKQVLHLLTRFKLHDSNNLQVKLFAYMRFPLYEPSTFSVRSLFETLYRRESFESQCAFIYNLNFIPPYLTIFENDTLPNVKHLDKSKIKPEQDRLSDYIRNIENAIENSKCLN